MNFKKNSEEELDHNILGLAIRGGTLSKGRNKNSLFDWDQVDIQVVIDEVHMVIVRQWA